MADVEFTQRMANTLTRELETLAHAVRETGKAFAVAVVAQTGTGYLEVWRYTSEEKKERIANHPLARTEYRSDLKIRLGDHPAADHRNVTTANCVDVGNVAEATVVLRSAGLIA